MQTRHSSECNFGNLDKMVTSVVELLRRKGLTISSAESCTGGLLSELITSVPGASEVFEIGLCTYSVKMKNKMLGVPLEIIEEYGVVSCETARAMTEGLKKVSGADVCVSGTGIAGPCGGTPDVPVGTVCYGFDICGNIFTVKDNTAETIGIENITRDNVRHAAAESIFSIVEKALMEADQ